MRFLWRAGTAVALATGAATLLLSTATFAQNTAPLNVDYVGLHQTKSGIDELVIKVSGLIVPQKGAPYTMNFDLANASITGAPGGPLGIAPSFTESLAQGASTTQVWDVPLNAPPHTSLSDLSLSSANLNLNEWNYNVKPAQELAVGGVSPLGTLPYGQLPEVPWAAALPMLALGIGVVVWRRRPHAQTL
jgi:hypothetical protein